MTTDLDYFYEKDLDKTNIKDFYDSLPSHLKSKFARCNRTNIAWGNVLQGYRGPPNMCNNGSGDSDSLQPTHGIQEVRFWWGARKDLNMQIPVFGTFAFGLGRVVQSVQGQLDWSSLYFDSKTGECLSHDKNEAAVKLNTKGRQLFEEGKYHEAAEYYNNAYINNTRSSEYTSFKENANRAESELKAISLNSEADYLFGQGRYSEAIDKYREAYDISQVSNQYLLYESNRKKAQAELDAQNLCSQADSLFEQGKYSEAELKYQEAYDKSKIEKGKNLYSSKKAQTVINKLLDALWKNAWDAENDSEKDRAEEAKNTFQTILNESKNSLESFPDNSKLKQYETLATLKIEGNEIFNQGLESQRHGILLFEQAQELKEKAKYESANAKFNQAKNKFSEAKVKFESGSEYDQRFASCIEFVQERLEAVADSIKITEQYMIGAGLQNLDIDIANDSRLLDDKYFEPNKSNQCSNYSQQI